MRGNRADIAPLHPAVTLVLTLDADLQKALQNCPAKPDRTPCAPPRASEPGGSVRAGAAVVVDVRTGGILAAASLPGFDLSRYRSDYAALSADSCRSPAGPGLPGAVCAGFGFQARCGGRSSDSGHRPRRYRQLHRYGTFITAATTPAACNTATAGRWTCAPRWSTAATFSFTIPGGGWAWILSAPWPGSWAWPTTTGVEITAAQGRLTWSTDDNYQARPDPDGGHRAGQHRRHAAAAGRNTRPRWPTTASKPTLHFADRAVHACHRRRPCGSTPPAFTDDPRRRELCSAPSGTA